jgi:hypothetical protein
MVLTRTVGWRCAGDHVQGMQEIMYPRTAPALPLADDFWLMSHSEQSGRPRLAPAFVNFGLAGALLAELTLQSGAALASEQHVLVSSRPPTNDPATSWVWAEIARARTSAPVGRWVMHLSDHVEPHVVARLQASRIVEEVKGLFGKRRAVPSDTILAAAPRVRMLHQVSMAACDEQTAMLGALAVATGLDTVIAHDAGRDSLRDPLVAAARATLSEPMAAIANAVRSATTQATLSVRR